MEEANGVMIAVNFYFHLIQLIKENSMTKKNGYAGQEPRIKYLPVQIKKQEKK